MEITVPRVKLDTSGLERLADLAPEVALNEAVTLLGRLATSSAFLDTYVLPLLQEAGGIEQDWYVAHAGDGCRASGELRPEHSEVRLEPLYTVTFTTPEAWSVEVAADDGTEGRGFLLAEGRSTGRLSARYRAANFPRKRTDGTLVPEFRGVLETDDGAAILFEWQGLAVLDSSGMRRLLGSLVHTADAPRYRWLNDRVCAVEGEVRPRTDGSGFEVVFEVSEMVWEGVT